VLCAIDCQVVPLSPPHHTFAWSCCCRCSDTVLQCFVVATMIYFTSDFTGVVCLPLARVAASLRCRLPRRHFWLVEACFRFPIRSLYARIPEHTFPMPPTRHATTECADKIVSAIVVCSSGCVSDSPLAIDQPFCLVGCNPFRTFRSGRPCAQIIRQTFHPTTPP
jgi:hypothetical protein